MVIPQLAATQQNGHIEPEIAELFQETGIDLSLLPAIMTPEQLAPAINTTTNALAQDRHESSKASRTSNSGNCRRRCNHVR